MPDSVIKVDNLSGLTSSGVGLQDGSVSSPALKFTNDSDTGLYRVGNNTLGFTVGGTERFRVGSDGLYSVGSVTQVVSVTKSDVFTTTSSAFISVPGLSVDITPKSVNSKILVLINISYIDSNSHTFQSRVLRNNTPVGIGNFDSNFPARTLSTVAGQRTTSDPSSPLTQSMQFIDLPSSISSLTYVVQVMVQATSTLHVNRSGDGVNDVSRSSTISTLTLMEIGG